MSIIKIVYPTLNERGNWEYLAGEFWEDLKSPSKYLRSLWLAAQFRIYVSGCKWQDYQWKEVSEGRFPLKSERTSQTTELSSWKYGEFLVTGAFQV